MRSHPTVIFTGMVGDPLRCANASYDDGNSAWLTATLTKIPVDFRNSLRSHCSLSRTGDRSQVMMIRFGSVGAS
ncbi:MAG: hypothetical protein MUF49_17885 [Oculatellaceae cyanobacterium Prado106]|nr:hypothetical protein [Oculatellaceae cyanobacterium Prado106]